MALEADSCREDHRAPGRLPDAAHRIRRRFRIA
jgi:hypothetical protein